MSYHTKCLLTHLEQTWGGFLSGTNQPPTSPRCRAEAEHHTRSAATATAVAVRFFIKCS